MVRLFSLRSTSRLVALVVVAVVGVGCTGGGSPEPDRAATSPAVDDVLEPAPTESVLEPTPTESESAASQVQPCDLVSLAMVETAVRTHIGADAGELDITQGAQAEVLCSFNVEATSDEGPSYVWSDAGITGFVVEVWTGPSAQSFAAKAPAGTPVATEHAGEATWSVCPGGMCAENPFDQAFLLVEGAEATAMIVFIPFGDEAEVKATAIDIAEAAWAAQG